MTITITQGHLHTRQLCRRKHKAMATHKAEAGSHSSNSAENTNSQSHKLPMTITIHSAGASSQSSNNAENTNTNTKASEIHYKKWGCKICLMLIVIFLLLYE
ncbi:hypothetical protein ACB098_09G044500 [Castanea mollissima]